MSTSDGTDDGEGEDSANRAKDLSRAALKAAPKWLVGLFFAWVFWYAHVQPAIAISATVLEGLFVLLALVLFAWAIRDTTQRADTVESV